MVTCFEFRSPMFNYALIQKTTSDWLRFPQCGFLCVVLHKAPCASQALFIPAFRWQVAERSLVQLLLKNESLLRRVGFNCWDLPFARPSLAVKRENFRVTTVVHVF